MEAKATLKYSRISAKKMQPICKLVRGLPIQEAIATLQFTPKKGAQIIRKVIESARANAHERKVDVDTLKIKSVVVDRGPIMYRMMSRQRGMAYRIRKRLSHVTVVVGDE